MSRMTIEQAISHAREVAEKNRANCERNTIIIPNRWISDAQCAEEHEQLAVWLEELKRYRELKEQGKLIELPCAVGDKVYSVHSAGLSHAVIAEVYTDAFCLMLCVAEGRFGKTVFTTKEAAEAKLKEMEGAE